MTEHLLALELGPVVEIIAAARKTRDLYFGSWMLSEIAKTVAFRVASICGDKGREHEALIVPAPLSMNELLDERFAIGDEVLVRVPATMDPRGIVDAARQAAHDRWLRFANEARWQVQSEEARIHRSLLRDGEGDIWHEQTSAEVPRETAGELVEIYGAWVPLDVNYQESVRELRRLLFGRIGCRNFPPGTGHAGIPKSSLDGRRETVIVRSGDDRQSIQSRKLRLNRGEQLDALGVTKRAGDGKKNFPSTARLAADPWIVGAKAAGRPNFGELLSACEQLARNRSGDEPILGRVEVTPPAFPHYPGLASFPYEGAILFENRHHDFFDEASLDDSERADADGRIANLRRSLRSVIKDMGEPGTYYVALAADGDRIGDALRQCNSPTEHREFSVRLSEFAQRVRRIVDEHRGALIFAAGEDIGALLPLDRALACSDVLRRVFATVVNESHATRRATLSVGLAIGHFSDALDDTLAAAREMEAVAKQGAKNALAVQYRPRGGAPIQFRAAWADEPVAEMERWMSLLANRSLPDKVAYDLRRIAEFYRAWPTTTDEERVEQRRGLSADLLRLLSGKRAEASEAIRPLVQSITSPADVSDLAHKIIIAGIIQQARRQVNGGAE